MDLIRSFSEPLGFFKVGSQEILGTDGSDVLRPNNPPEPNGLPGALGFWSLNRTSNGVYVDGRGELGDLRAYTHNDNQALQRVSDFIDGPRPGTSGLSFNGADQFAYLGHDSAFQVTQGTIALWVRPDDLSGRGAILTKDSIGQGTGGHFRLLHLEGGGVFLRFAAGDGGHNRAWRIDEPIFVEGEWAHLAINFTTDGIVVWKDGVPLDDDLWMAVEGDVDTPGTYSEAFFLENEEPWVFGADQRLTIDNDGPQAFAADSDRLSVPFEGAIAEFGFWGGYDVSDALNQNEISSLIANGPGAGLTNPSGPQPLAASDDVIKGRAGDDIIDGGAGDDFINGGTGNDTIDGGYGNDRIYGGDGDDTLNGGRGSDLIVGGEGDDTMIAGGDVGEDRAGQLVLASIGMDQPLRPASIDAALLDLTGWADHRIYADDIFVGGSGADHLKVQTYINAKRDVLLDHVMSDGRMIHWHGVAGENDYIHDHWVEGIGIDVFGDFNSKEDRISVMGHTTNIEISYSTVDTDADGVKDSVLSLVQLYSQQGTNGGAHDEDLLGVLAVIGDVVTEDLVEIDSTVHYGIVTTIDELQEALAPSYEPSYVDRPDGISGYDDRDVEGRPILSDPLGWSVNPFMDVAEVSFDWSSKTEAPLVQVNSHAGGLFDGSTVLEMVNLPGEQQAEGTYLLTFAADQPGAGNQAILSKDHWGYEDGGHLMIWINSSGYLRVRFQSDEANHYLQYAKKIVAGQSYDIAFSFGPGGMALYVDGALAEQRADIKHGMLGNANSSAIGASTRNRKADSENLEWFFEGEISNVSVLDTQIDPIQAIFLATNSNDLRSLGVAAVEQDTDGTWVGSQGGDFILGTNENDRITSLGGDDIIQAGDGDDEIDPGAGSDTIHGGAGSDWLNYSSNQHGVSVYIGIGEVYAADGKDTLFSVENVVGSGYVDRIVGTSGDNMFFGGAGDDIIVGKGGEDTLDGGVGDDYLRGDNGSDTMHGGTGSDILIGLGGEDVLNGDAGFDYIYGGRDADTIFGGAGSDFLRGNLGGDFIDGGAGDDDIRGGGNGDVLNGEAGNDFILGGGGTDRIAGGAGNDVLFGGVGDDDFDGQQDTFIFTSAAFGAGGFDRIRDFENDIDRIDLSTFGFSDFDTEVLSLARNSGSAMRINFGGGDVLYVDNFQTDDFDVGDVVLS